jgi:hypothetical protein
VLITCSVKRINDEIKKSNSSLSGGGCTLTIGGDNVKDYKLLIEELEEKVAPANMSMGGQ